jgi:N-acetylglucosamine-6-sulfatase
MRRSPAALAAVLLVTLGLSFSQRSTAVAVPARKPNIVIILSDDQRWDTLTPRYMPVLFRTLIPNGITYSNSFVPNPLCCPSRAATLTGNYSETTGVWSNAGDLGGFDGFNSHGNAGHTIAVDFHAAGYRTGLVGKYLNGYPQGHYGYVAPGWDSWFSVPTGVYYNYFAAKEGHKSRLYGSVPRDYAGRILTTRSLQFIDRSVEKGGPFFLYLAFTAPHDPSIPDPRDLQRYGPEWPNGEPPSYGEADVTDKPQYVQEQAARWDQTKASIDAFHAQQLDAIHSVDREVGRVWNALPDDTYVLYASDNGILWGEHDRGAKGVPYNESLRVPMVLAYKGSNPPFPIGTTDPRIALNVDYLPTLEHLAGVSPVPGHTVAGTDILTRSRSSFVIGHQGTTVPTYCGVRSLDWMYVKYITGEEELYNEQADPFELTYLASAPGRAGKLAEMRQLAQDLCTGGAWYPSPWPFG